MGQRPQAGLAGHRERALEDGALLGRGARVRFVRAGEVGPHARDVHVPGVLRGAGGRDEARPLLGARAEPAHAGVDLEVDPGGAPGAPGGVDHLRERPRRADRQVDVRRQGLVERCAGGVDPGQDPRRDGVPVPRRRIRVPRGAAGGRAPGRPGGRAWDPRGVESGAQHERLGELGDAQPGGAARQCGAGDRDEPVPVGVRLDHREDRGARRARGEGAHVVPDRGQVDDRARGSLPAHARHPRTTGTTRTRHAPARAVTACPTRRCRAARRAPPRAPPRPRPAP